MCVPHLFIHNAQTTPSDKHVPACVQCTPHAEASITLYPLRQAGAVTTAHS